MDKAKKDFEIHFLSNGPSMIPSGIIKIGSRISDFIAIGGKIVLSDPTIVNDNPTTEPSNLLQQITQEIIKRDVEENEKLAQLMLARRV